MKKERECNMRLRNMTQAPKNECWADSISQMLQNRQAADGATLRLRQIVFDELSRAGDAGGVSSAERCVFVGLGLMHTVEGVLPFDAHAITAVNIVRDREVLFGKRVQRRKGKTCAA